MEPKTVKKSVLSLSNQRVLELVSELNRLGFPMSNISVTITAGEGS